MRRTLIHVFIASFLAVAPACIHAQEERATLEDRRTLELLDRIKEILRRPERGRKPDDELIKQLRDIVKRYDWPWRKRLLYDDFSDGDYTSNPVWTVVRGEFWVAPGLGLRTFVAPAPLSKSDPATRKEVSSLEITADLLQGAEGRESRAFREAGSQISTRIALANDFAIKLRMVSRITALSGLRVEFGPFHGGAQDWGFRVAYSPSENSVLELLRVTPGRTTIIARHEGPVALEDGKPHDFDWRRDSDGNMWVMLDGKEVIRAFDHTLTDFFDGFTLINRGGDYVFERIEIFTAER